MRRIAFKMRLKPGFKEEYKRRHDAIWPGLRVLLKEAGVCDYSIFFDEETDCLFAVQCISGNHSSQDLAGEEVVKKWWKYMADIMDTHADFSPVMAPLEMVFHMD
jgi:L-rhamnose mutarotase